MSDSLDPENAAFWLPSSFLNDDFIINSNNNDDFLFNNGSSSSLDSPVSSTETELGDINSNDNDELLAELTRHLAHSSLNDKGWKFSTSPQSTLTGFGPFTTRSGFSSNGSPNGPSPKVPSPPLTPPPKNDAAWELLYEAAGQVARLKMNALAAEMNHHQHHHHNHHNNNRLNNLQQPNRGLLGVPRNVSLPRNTSLYDFPQYEQVKRQGNGNFYCQHHTQQRRSCNGGPAPGPLGLPHNAWPTLRPNNHHNHHNRQTNGNGLGVRSIYLNGPGHGPIPGVKRQSTGTGVFLPRRVQQPAPPEPRKNSNGCSSVLLPGRVVDALNMEFEEVNNGVNANSRVRFGSGMLSEQEIIMARRNAVMEQQRRNLTRNDEIRLPNDWTY